MTDQIEQNQIERNFEKNDLLIFAPLVAGTIALTYDVGYFQSIGIGYFSLFSLAEHVVFAIQASPYAIACTLIFGMVLAARSLQNVQNRIGRHLSNIGLFFAALGLLMLVVDKSVDASILKISSISLMWLGYLLFLLSPTILTVPPSIYYILMIGGGLTLVFGTGVTFGEVRMRSHSNDEIELRTEGHMNASIIRSGDRGVLFVDQSTSSIQFRQWGDIVAIKHPISK